MYAADHKLDHQCWLQQRDAEIALAVLDESEQRHLVRGKDGVLIDVTDGLKVRERTAIERMKTARALIGRTEA